MKKYLGAMILAAGLAFAGSAAVNPAAAAPADNASPASTAKSGQLAGTTDMSARRRGYYRRGFVRPYRPYYGSYGYYRPRPQYYRPYYRPYYAPAPIFSFGFGPRYY